MYVQADKAGVTAHCFETSMCKPNGKPKSCNNAPVVGETYAQF